MKLFYFILFTEWYSVKDEISLTQPQICTSLVIKKSFRWDYKYGM